MPTRGDVLAAAGREKDYHRAARLLGVPPGRAYLIATGLPADGGDTLSPEDLGRPGMLDSSTQHLVYVSVPAENLTQKPHLLEWIKRRAAADLRGRRAAGARDAAPGEPLEVTNMVTVALSKHEATEQEVLWLAVRSVLGSDVVGQALAQQEGRDVLTALGKASPDAPEFDELVEKLDKVARGDALHREGAR